MYVVENLVRPLPEWIDGQKHHESKEATTGYSQAHVCVTPSIYASETDVMVLVIVPSET